MKWAEKQGFAILHIQPGQTQQNNHIERCNRTVGHQWLDCKILESIEPYSDCSQSPNCQWGAQDQATHWLWTCTNDRPTASVMVCRKTMAGRRGIGGITLAHKLIMAA